jgi:POT family proton-dependent oligopeptide transporter
MSLPTLLSKQPKPFWTLAFGEFFNTFSYFGTQTILVLYLIHTFHLTQSDSYLLYGAYVALTYSLPILGGIVADKGLGDKTTAILGSGLNILGNFILMLPQHYLFCLGLAISLVGCGLYKSSATHLVGTLYGEKGSQKETGFTLLYLAINAGGVLGPLIYSLIIYTVGWNYGFFCSALGILIATIILLKNGQQLQQPKKSAPLSIYIGIFCLCLLFSLPFYIPALINILILILFAVSIMYLVVSIKKYTGKDRRHLIALSLISFFALFYFAAGLQIGATITLFIQQKIQEGIISTKLPASIFSSLYPFFVLLLAPIFTYIWHRLPASTPTKLIIGMMLAALGISAFAIASSTSYVITGILIGNLLLSAGELAISPAVYTAISDLSPAGMKSTMMGSWFLCIGLGGYLSSVLANAAHFVARITDFHSSAYADEFIFIACFTFAVVMILVLFRSKLVKMMV